MYISFVHSSLRKGKKCVRLTHSFWRRRRNRNLLCELRKRRPHYSLAVFYSIKGNHFRTTAVIYASEKKKKKRESEAKAPEIKFGSLISKTYCGNEAALKSDLLQDGWQPKTKYRPGASVVIGSFIDFRACRHAWGDLLFENNCSIRGFIQAPAGYLRHYYCPIRIPRRECSDPVLICGLDGREPVSLHCRGLSSNENRVSLVELWENVSFSTSGDLDKVIMYIAFHAANTNSLEPS